jgi:hypothetical protein
MENIDEEFRTAALPLSQRAAGSHSGENSERLDLPTHVWANASSKAADWCHIAC